MRLFRALAAAITLVIMAAGSAMADPGDAVFNKEGVWGIDVDNGSCAAGMILKDGSTFLLRGTRGDIHVALFSREKLRRGKVTRIETEAYGFDFVPGWSKTTLHTATPINARAVAALRQARTVTIMVDQQPLIFVILENTGFEQALDGLIACSNGERGWWGQGVGATQANAEPKAASSTYKDEGVWTVAATGDTCAALAAVGDGVHLVVLAANGGHSVMLSAGGVIGKRGRRGEIAIDAVQVAFKPSYGSARFVSTGFLDVQTLSALRGARSLRFSIDGRSLIDADLEGSGFADVFASLLGCAAGQDGWWGKGAVARSS